MCYHFRMHRRFTAPGLILGMILLFPLGAQQDTTPQELEQPAPNPYRLEAEAMMSAVRISRPDLAPAVREALEILPRHKYVPENLASMAYHNRTLPLGEGLFIPAPSDLGAAIGLLGLTRRDRVLVVGTAAGYAADLISLIAAEVVLVEENSRERERMVDLLTSGERTWGTENLTILPGWTLTPLLTGEEFDAVFVHGGVTRIPEPLFALLGPVARMAVPLMGDSGFSLLGVYQKSPLGESLSVYEELFFPKIQEW